MKNLRADAVGAIEALEIYSRGEYLTCPSCGATIVSIPESLVIGVRPLGLKCPVNLNHFLIRAEPADAMRAVREEMRKIAAGKGNKLNEE